MNPHNNELPAMQLPAPLEQVHAEGPATAAAEQVTTAPERGPTISSSSPASPAPVMQLPVPSTLAAAPANDPATTPTAGLQVKDDGDLIEKEWVNKAKEIVERTRDDPYKQSEELTVFKADYMKKRYNKTIKVSK
jgi:hypothetical protein